MASHLKLWLGSRLLAASIVEGISRGLWYMPGHLFGRWFIVFLFVCSFPRFEVWGPNFGPQPLSLV